MTPDLSRHRAMAVGRRSLADVAYDTLRAAISAGEWPPGHVLVEQDLTATLQMSRTPIREALRRLQADMFLEVGRSGGAIVPDRGVQDLVHDYMIRAEIEGLAAALAADRITQDEIAELEVITERMVADLDIGVSERYLKLNESFHAKVVEASHYERLVTFHEVLRDSIRVASHRQFTSSSLSQLSAALAEHQQVIEALRRRDAELARSVSRTHVLEGVKWLTRIPETPVATETTQGTSPAQGRGGSE